MPEPNDDFSIKTAPAREKKEKSGYGRGCLIAGVIFAGLFTIAIVLGFAFIMFIGLIGSTLTDLSLPQAKSSQYKFREEYVSGEYFSGNKIAMIEIQGVILSATSNPMFTVADSNYICDQLKYIAEDQKVKALVIKINSPGGEVVATDNIHHQLQKIRKERKIPVIAVMESMAASGGYYVAAGCDYIVAHRMTFTGSIGVIIKSYKYIELFKKVGLQANVFKSGKMKDILSGARPDDPAERKVIQILVDNSYLEFVKIVAAGRPKLTVDKIRTTKIGDGRIFDGEQALKLNLVDQLGYFDDAVTQAAKKAKLGKDYQVVRYMPHFSFAQLFGQANSSSKKLEIKLPGAEKMSGLETGKMYYLPENW